MCDSEPLTARPSYCGKPHRTTDGVPLAHRCRVLPPEALRAELWGDHVRALRIFAACAAAGQVTPHTGIWKVHRR
jgi:hypothetical protein